jgi:flagellar operon protein
MNERIHVHQMYQPALLPKRTTYPNGENTFQSMLDKQLHPSITISKHAKRRLEDRDIKITDASWNKISMKMEEAKEKGIKDSLVILKDVTLVVNAPNQTVITALTRSEAHSQIFTNINGAIVIDA